MTEIQEAVKILKIPYQVTKMLQKFDATLSDFYGSCIMMKEKLKMHMNKDRKLTDLAEKLLNEFEKRRSKILNNQAMIATVYLDRRFSAELDPSQIALAKLTLSNLWERARKLGTKSNETPEPNDEANRLENEDEEVFSFEQYFKTKGIIVVDSNVNDTEQPITNNRESSTSNGHTPAGPNYMKNKSEFLILLDEFERKFPIISHNSPIIDFWEQQKNDFPEIYEIAIILLGTPPSQSGVERSFSQFGLVLTCRRCNIGSQVLQDILTIKLNKDLAYEVFKNDLSKTKADFEASDLEQF